MAIEWLPYADGHSGVRPSVAGDIRVCRAVAGQGLKPRDLVVYIPRSLARGEGAARSYPVLYMHDGQNLFDSSTSFAGEWGVDEAAEAAADAGHGEVIVVAVPNAQAQRAYEYCPWKTEAFGWGGGGDVYLDFLAKTVRPLVESSWPVRTDPAGIGIAGSSLGGLISLYAALERPDEYGYCGAFSPALFVSAEEIFALAEAKAGDQLKVYLDVGRKEALGSGGLEPDGATPYVGAVRRMRGLLMRRGAATLYSEDDGEHNEAAWRRRFPGFLDWFLAGVGAQALPNTTR